MSPERAEAGTSRSPEGRGTRKLRCCHLAQQ